MRAEVIIIGGGPSLKGFDFNRLHGHDCIAANQAVFDTPSPRYFVTVDQTFLHKIKRPIPLSTTRVFIVNMATGFLIEQDGRIIDKRMNLVYDFSQFDTIIKSLRCDGVGQTIRDFRNGANSGFAALQLALLLGYTRIRLLGIDLTTSGNITHYHKAYSSIRPGFLEKFHNHFIGAIPEIKRLYPDVELISCSPISKLNSLLPYQEFI